MAVFVALTELLGGLLLAFAGGELFLRGVVGIAAWLRIPKAVAAATLAAFATSSPEISVAVNAGLLDEGPVALGDALGSNIVNVGLVLGLVLVIGPVPFRMVDHRREFVLALLVPLVILAILADGWYSRWEAVGSLVFFSCWLFLAVRHALKERSPPDANGVPRRGWIPFTLAAVGLVLLAGAGKLIVAGGTDLGTIFQLDPFFIGVTVVALGTSTPELATAVVSKLRGHDEVGVGTVLGSNIFNCLFIVGLTGAIRPFAVEPKEVGVSIAFGVFTVLCLYPGRSGSLSRTRGFLLLALYAGSIAAAAWTQVK